MKPAIPVTRTACALVASLALASCSLMRGPWKQPQQTPPPSEPPTPVLAPPVATSRFEITPDQDIVGVVQVTTSSQEDTLTDIARRFNVGYEEIVRANPGVDPWLPGEGTQIVIPSQFILPNAPREGIVINLAQMRIFYYPRPKKGEPQLVYTHPIGIGRIGWATPLGTTKIVRHKKDPTWHPPASVIKEHRERGEKLDRVVPPGPDNPLGHYAFYLGWPAYMIHGTNKPAGVGLRSSHGCIRLFPEDIEELYKLVPIGTKVRVVNQPFVFGWRDDQLYLQAFDVLEDDPRDWQNGEKKLVSKALGEDIRRELKKRNREISWERVSAVAHDPHGIPVSVLDDSATLQQVLAAAPRVENRVPEGASWDGKSDLPMDEATFREMFSEREEATPAKSEPSAPAAVPAAKTGT